MYREHFGLSTAPFGISPRLDFLFRSAAFEESMAHLLYGLENSEAVVLITGAIGTGKTMAVQSFLAHLGNRFMTALVTNTRVDGKELLKLVLDDLGGLPPGGADKSDLLIAFKQLLIEAGRNGRRVVIVIDEAQNLDRDVLEEIRLLTNLGQGDEQPVQVVLVGQPELEGHVDQPELAQLRQRIRVHCRLAPLTRPELKGYVERRIEVAGGRPGLFSSQALDRIYALSGGVPRVINTLCSEALLAAFVAGRHQVEAQDVGEHRSEAVADSDDALVPVGLPAPTRVAAEAAAAAPSGPSRKAVPPAMARKRGNDIRRGGVSARVWWVMGTIALVAGVLAVTGLWRPMRDAAVGRKMAPVDAAAAPQARRQMNTGGGAGGDSVSTAAGLRVSGAPDSTRGPKDGTQSPAASAADAVSAVGAARAAEPQGAAPDTGSARDAGRPAGAARDRVADIAVARDVAALATAPATNDWYIHVSSFRTAPHAASVAESFGRNGMNATVREQVVRDMTWHRVYLGPFPTHDAAVRRANDLRDAGEITYYKVEQMAADGES